MKLIFFNVIVILFTLSSCTSTQYVLLDNSDKKGPQIDIYLSGIQKPSKDYEILAYIETTGSAFTLHNKLVKGLKKKAAKLGGDAVIEVNFFYIPWGFSSLPSVEGVVVKYKE